MLQKWGRNGYRKCTRTRSKNKVTVLIDSKQLINDNFVGQTVKLLSIFVFLFWNQQNICICLWYLNKNGVSQFEWMEIGAECFYTRWCICACWMSLSLPGSVGFCLFGTDQYAPGVILIDLCGMSEATSCTWRAEQCYRITRHQSEYGFSKRLCVR